VAPQWRRAVADLYRRTVGFSLTTNPKALRNAANPSHHKGLTRFFVTSIPNRL
jgi:hypothetical protein